jgi:hypothetical protein
VYLSKERIRMADYALKQMSVLVYRSITCQSKIEIIDFLKIYPISTLFSFNLALEVLVIYNLSNTGKDF